MTLILISLSLLIFIAVILALAGYAFVRAFYIRSAGKRLQQKGVEAEAVLLNMQQTGVYVNDLPQVILQMQVQPKTGRNFVTETETLLSFKELTEMHIGHLIHVKYNPSNIKEVMLVKH